MAVISFVAIGIVLGLVARILVPRGRSGGMLSTLMIGVAGAVIGGVLGAAGFRKSMNDIFAVPSLAFAVLVGIVGLGIWVVGQRWAAGQKSAHDPKSAHD